MSDEQAEPRLAMPDMVSWPIFPYEGDMQVKPLLPRLDEERVRNGDPGGDPCHRCFGEAEDAVWSNDRWAVRAIKFGDQAAPFPAYMLETVACLDMADLDDTYAAELGVLTLRMERAIMSLGTVGRVHFNRWGDGARHFHVWFLGRPAGAWQFSGYTLPLWGFTLPPLEYEIHESNNGQIAEFLSSPGATALLG